jgi:hypothetical protein
VGKRQLLATMALFFLFLESVIFCPEKLYAQEVPLGKASGVESKYNLAAVGAKLVKVASVLSETLDNKTLQVSNIFITPDSIDFGSVSVNLPSSSHKITIANKGTSALFVNSIAVAGADNEMFSLSPDSCHSLTPTIAQGKKCSIKVVFLPTSPGVKNGYIAISSNEPDVHDLTVPLTGTAEWNGLSQARSVGISDNIMRVSGLRRQGVSQVADYLLNKNTKSLSLINNSVSTSLPPGISDLVSAVFPIDTDVCGNDYPERVRLTFEYQDPNADVLGGRVGIGYSCFLRSGAGPITGQLVGTFFPQPKTGLILDPPSGKNGVIVVDTCWLNVSHIDFTVQLRDGDENLSEETLTTSVDIPESVLSEQSASESKSAIKGNTLGGIKPTDW